MPIEEVIVRPESAPVTVALEPAHNTIHSLMLLTDADALSGLGEWVLRTAAALSPEERAHNRLVILGFYHAIVPGRSWPSFPAYVDHLAASDPRALRDRMMDFYARIPCKDEAGEMVCGSEKEGEAADWQGALRDVDSYLAFLRQRFSEDRIDVELESEAYRYAREPAAMQELIVAHLGHMWEAYMADEWARVRPMLDEAVAAFRQADLGGMDRREAAEWITGQRLEGKKWDRLFERGERIVLVPSAHVGPYLGKMWAGETHWLVFGARLPQGMPFHAPDLSRTEIVVRLSALADDTRLRILRRIVEEGELSSQEIIAGLDLSQSAASRHLKQLSATGYLRERRCSGAKCYRLDGERVEDTLRAVEAFLLGK